MAILFYRRGLSLSRQSVLFCFLFLSLFRINAWCETNGTLEAIGGVGSPGKDGITTATGNRFIDQEKLKR